MTLVTLDTNVLPAHDLLEAARGKPYDFARVTVTDRELEGAPPRVHMDGTQQVPETAVWDESPWGEAVWASDSSHLEGILSIISNGGFPSDRSNLSEGQRRELRDAMILEAHLREHRDIFVTDDCRALMKYGKRELLERRFRTMIRTRAEFRALLK